MLKSLEYDEIVSIIYQNLIKCTNLDCTNIRNIDGLQGASLTHLISSVKYDSIHIKDSFIIFELVEDSDQFYISKTASGNEMVSSYNLYLKCYGNPSHTLIKQFLCRFKTDDNLIDLNHQGIYISSIDSPSNHKEFINNILWPRCDITIKLTTRYEIDNTDNNYFDTNLKLISIKL